MVGPRSRLSAGCVAGHRSRAGSRQHVGIGFPFGAQLPGDVEVGREPRRPCLARRSEGLRRVRRGGQRRRRLHLRTGVGRAPQSGRRRLRHGGRPARRPRRPHRHGRGLARHEKLLHPSHVAHLQGRALRPQGRRHHRVARPADGSGAQGRPDQGGARRLLRLARRRRRQGVPRQRFRQGDRRPGGAAMGDSGGQRPRRGNLRYTGNRGRTTVHQDASRAVLLRSEAGTGAGLAPKSQSPACERAPDRGIPCSGSASSITCV